MEALRQYGSLLVERARIFLTSLIFKRLFNQQTPGFRDQSVLGVLGLSHFSLYRVICFYLRRVLSRFFAIGLP